MELTFDEKEKNLSKLFDMIGGNLMKSDTYNQPLLDSLAVKGPKVNVKKEQRNTQSFA
jgi:hypothetical protein